MAQLFIYGIAIAAATVGVVVFTRQRRPSYAIVRRGRRERSRVR